MSEQNVALGVKIKDIRFYTPVQIDLEFLNLDNSDRIGEPVTLDGGIDLARKTLQLKGDTMKLHPEIVKAIEESVFAFLHKVTYLPEDTFMAGDEVYDQVERATAEHQNMQNQMGNF